ncbi:hypothetical protein LDENG_00040320, partial [Lucifuga dentata]
MQRNQCCTQEASVLLKSCQERIPVYTVPHLFNVVAKFGPCFDLCTVSVSKYTMSSGRHQDQQGLLCWPRDCQ